ncbi:hypothetical protein ABTY59_23865 [Streptomyces sp. NPDC096079]|uniref:hypothetical protein n=1 Tax=Streptomyces sp. NPDC096079 TaxID=3155820 RepID=UPI00331DE41E
MNPSTSQNPDASAPGRVGVTGPVPLVIARRIADLGDRAAPQQPRTPDAPRGLQLLSARSLTPGLGVAPPGFPVAPAPPGPGGSRPVVPARWADSPGTGTAHPIGSAGSPAVQRAAVAAVSPDRAPARAASSSAALPEARRAGGPLPVAGPHGPVVVQPGPAPLPPLGAARPEPHAPAVPMVPAVPQLRSRPAPSQTTPPVQRAASGPPTATPAPVQRKDGGGPRSSSVPVRGERDSGSTKQSTSADTDLDDMARKLIEPVTRLLRAELRRGRERAGRPFDGRR